MFRALLDMAFPMYCLTCHQSLDSQQQQLCLACEYALPINEYYKTPTQNPLIQRFTGRFMVKYAFSYLNFVNKGKTQKLLHELKYEGNQAIGEYLGQQFGKLLYENGFATTFDLIVPIPLHSSKLKQRGYNQVDSIAKGMAESLHTTWQADALIRTRANQQQAKQDKEGRLKNAEALFVVNENTAIKGKNILLLDDMITSGATIEAAALPIIEAGCQTISIASLASAL
jgi:ComF family protein